jgi:hypothetical protein
MPKYENTLSSRDSALNLSDKIRIVGSDTRSYVTLLSALAGVIVNNYTGTSLAGAAQSIKNACDSLAQQISAEVTARQNAISGEVSARNTAIASAISAEANAREAVTGSLANLSTETKASLVAAINEVLASASGLKDAIAQSDIYAKLQASDIPGTTQTCVRDSDGKITQTKHMSGSTVIRSDVYTRTATTFTEVRTLNTGQKLTLATNKTTKETTVTYSAS